MFSRCLSLFCACTAGVLLLAGCQAMRGPEPVGQTFVAPPGPIARSGTIRAVPPVQPQYGQGVYGQPQYAQPPYAQPQYGDSQFGQPQPQYGQPQYGQPQYGQSPSGQPQYGQPQYGQPSLPNPPGAQSYAPSAPPTYAPGAQSQYAPAPAPAAVPGSSAGQVTLRIAGPTQVNAGSAANYRFDIANPSPTMARNVILTCQLPDNWTYVTSTPAGAVSGRQIQWRMNEVGANRTMAVDASFRPDAPGVANVCATINNDGGAAMQSCATTRVELPAAPGAPKGGPSIPTPAGSPLDVAISGPDRAAPGDKVTYSVTVTNRGSTRATKLLVTDTFGAGLTHDAATSPIERDLKDLEPGQSDTFKVTFRVARAGRHCHDVEVTGAGGLRATAQACVVVAGNPRVSVRQAATPTSATVAGTLRFAIDIKNEGDVDLTGIVVSPSFDKALKPTQATEVRGRQALINLKNDRYELTPWRFDRLEPGRSIQLDVECRAESASASACGRVTVTAQEGPREETVTCVKIDAGTGDGPK